MPLQGMVGLAEIKPQNIAEPKSPIQERYGAKDNSLTQINIKVSKHRCVSGFCLEPGYQRLELPSRPTTINVGMDVMDIMSVNDQDFTVSIYTHMALRWVEPRIYVDGKNTSSLKMLNAVDTLFKK